jgi:hypothetical protein
MLRAVVVFSFGDNEGPPLVMSGAGGRWMEGPPARRTSETARARKERGKEKEKERKKERQGARGRRAPLSLWHGAPEVLIQPCPNL